MAYTDIDKPTDYFNTVLYTGNAGTLNVTGVGFSPSLVWIKGRGYADSQVLTDTVRGTTKCLSSDSTTAEFTQTNGLTAFGGDGFTLGNWSAINRASTTVAWNWKKTADAGFDIVAYTGNGSNRTISHNLGAVPKMIIVKERDNANDWKVYHHSIGNGKSLRLDTTAAEGDDSTAWNSTTPTSSVFSVGTSNAVNRNGGGIIAYLFAEKQGYSKFGSYTGNGNADGTFVYTGFKPAFVLYKGTAADTRWIMIDNKRDNFNSTNTHALTANSIVVENVGFWDLDFLSNGFKLRLNDAEANGSGASYIYMAFAENPFTTSSGVPATAR